MYKVYYHKFPNNKYYIGLTKQQVSRRWGSNGNGYKEQPKIYNAITEFGWDNIEHVVVKDNLSRDEAQALERELIIEFDSIRNGYNCDKGGGCGGNPWIEINYNGDSFLSSELEQIATDGITSHDITTRIRNRGWSVERALSQPKIIKNSKYYYNGNYYTTSELAKMSGLPVGIICGRLNIYGWDVERAITQPTNVKNQPKGIGDKIFFYNEQMMNSYELFQYCKVDGLTQHNLVHRIIHEGWSIEKALTTPIKERNKKIFYNDKYYTTKELLAMNTVENLTLGDLTDRLRQGWDVERAITQPKRKSPKK